MALLIGDNSVVSMHYKLTNAGGELLDSSEGREPLTYLHGAGNIIPGLENARMIRSWRAGTSSSLPWWWMCRRTASW